MVSRKTVDVDRALDRLRLTARIDGARLRAQAHRLRSHGLDQCAALLEQHVADLERAVVEVDSAVAVLLEEHGDTVPIVVEPAGP